MGVMHSIMVQPIVAVERTVFYRERSAGMYSAIPFAFALRIPVWWRWYYWACPVSWTLRGLIQSQYGDDMAYLDANQTVAQFVKSHFGFSHDHLEVPAVMVAFFAVLFPAVFAVAINSSTFDPSNDLHCCARGSQTNQIWGKLF
ncbi:Pleiotropic drug resistance protein 4 [Platanthera guangdongensis]|uniref:Pleiotropic drug resistance protein 4 n=1 Tax=Platanthera guangdongensis TaxID=2320717 RepID=A0ABR2N1D7_9ASPA